jgi:hypothetical protein
LVELCFKKRFYFSGNILFKSPGGQTDFSPPLYFERFFFLPIPVIGDEIGFLLLGTVFLQIFIHFFHGNNHIKDRIFHVPGKQLDGLCGGAVEFCLGWDEA